ncbi:MAG: phosphate acyltransferase [Coxiella sp. RIFCSPHIGHO2_12_FULL_42_15]|nr:MAG: phosphate acyltransferase [Coxiella sp. RIFCSPHIGHO2_12_FULL_42_15]
MSKTIALDAMGGDHGPKVVVPAAAQILKRHSKVHLILVGHEAELQPLVRQYIKTGANRMTIQHAAEVVGMDESPGTALRQKKNSSMRVALDLVKEQKAHACVSAGNTGALMAMARFVLKTLPGIDRPAIVTGFPSHNGKETRILDLGANVDSTPENLYQFAVMGSVLSSEIDGIQRPRIALLNIGEEEIKGNELVKKAAELLVANEALNYVGYIEANHLFDNSADVVVCDGFVGNVMLKSIEGVIKLVAGFAREEFLRNFFTKLLIAPARPLIKRVIKRIDPERHNGAVLIGLDGIVVKSHGGASINAFTYAIEEAVLETEKNIPQLIKQQIERLLKVRESR